MSTFCDSFLEADPISVQPKDNGVPYEFEFAPSTSVTANDGAIPFGETVSTATVTAHEDDGLDTDATSILIVSSSVASNVVTVKLKYPNKIQIFHLTFELTLSGGAVIEFDFNRVSSEDI